jgi:hypothetical protein
VTKRQLEDARDPLRLVEAQGKQEDRHQGRRSHLKIATSPDDGALLRILAERNKELEAQIVDLVCNMHPSQHCRHLREIWSSVME